MGIVSTFFAFLGAFWAASIVSVVVFVLVAAMKSGQVNQWKLPLLCTLVFLNVFFHLWYWQWPSIRLDFLLQQ